MHYTYAKRPAFTLIEVLIVVAILIVLMAALMVTVIPSLSKGRDGRRKADLHKIATALEEYYNDKGMYPDHMSAGNVSDCGEGTVLSEYLKDVPCDPITKRPYAYYPRTCASGLCKIYGIYAVLDHKADPDVTKLGCNETNGCYETGGFTYNYGVAAGTTVDANGN